MHGACEAAGTDVLSVQWSGPTVWMHRLVLCHRVGIELPNLV